MSQKVLVAGTGISGIAAAKLLLAQGGEVVLYDGNEKLSAEELKKNFDEGAKVSVILGELKKLDLSGVELCVISPGISLEAPFVAVLDEARVPIWSEIELAYHCSQGKLIAITGTNGKTTTTALTGEIMRHFFNSVFVVGNIGDPYTDRHKTMDCYIQVKEGIARNQTEEDSCVLNYDDPELRAFGSTLKSKVIYFSRREKLDQGVYMDGDRIVYRHGGKTEPVLDVKDLQIIGGHNHENVMTAVAISLQMGVPIPVIREACMAFKAVEHRIEFVRERFGVTYYNDSKGTNPDAAIQAIRAMPGPTLLIAGGYDKHSEYDEWIESFDGKVRYLVLIGQTRDKIAECAKKHGLTDIMYAEDMQEAVQVCASYANAGDYVLLSPACASWGMFKNYEERGRIFKECVNNL